ncbi:XdhC/CoxI family protein [Octadecabacter sp. 1_MG-2023]|uniref:XdhC family protein n=1 Tax=unclassified Octadecabacter TaxID=196158 RepID=UPI001C0A5840|nr:MULTISPECIES: XdhC/CoxI family protein [unclassified Octadecabacter]MBU2993102.1 XdhC/CoxI family protein [Octadecabacter sp. B2R22]MDO6733446.1 XdhC/CoxI family protein [Octadecabacter sp. 1_MG-2023]
MIKYNNVLQHALEWSRSGQNVAVATVLETWGSALCGAGSQLVIREDGHMMGSVSGGCVEGAVVTEALDALEDGAARMLEYGVSDEDAFAVGLACGGRVKILVEPVGGTGQGAMPLDVLEDLGTAINTRLPVGYVADLNSGARSLVGPERFPDRFKSNRSGLEEGDKTFVAIHNPPLRVFVVGGVHIAQHLVPMAKSCGFDVVLIDPRPAFASAVRFPDVALSDDWPDAALHAAQLDSRSAVVTLTHDSKLDDPAIKAALRTDVFYLGCLGSTRTHAKRVERLKEAGFDDDDIARIHAPIGLDLGGRAPAEIAVSIMAEITQILHKG